MQEKETGLPKQTGLYTSLSNALLHETVLVRVFLESLGCRKLFQQIVEFVIESLILGQFTKNRPEGRILFFEQPSSKLSDR